MKRPTRRSRSAAPISHAQHGGEEGLRQHSPGPTPKRRFCAANCRRPTSGPSRLSDLALTVDAHTEVEAALRRLEGELKHAHQVKAGLDADLLQAHSTIEHLLADVEQLRSLADHQAAEHAALGNEARELRRHRDELNMLEASWARVDAETELTGASAGEDRDRIAAGSTQRRAPAGART